MTQAIAPGARVLTGINDGRITFPRKNGLPDGKDRLKPE
jgi:hypothetical protein